MDVNKSPLKRAKQLVLLADQLDHKVQYTNVVYNSVSDQLAAQALKRLALELVQQFKRSNA